MVALARCVFVRPKLDEECPEWARDLIPLSEQEHGLGVPHDRIPQATLEELNYFFPVPVPPKRQRRSEAQSDSKKYARTCGLAVFLACLPFALAKQLDLFTDAKGEGTGVVAVLGFRKLADLAKKIGMSYDRLQRWMTVLLALGFIWRFRDGKRTLYVIPLSAYAPRPSPEGVRNKLTALIHSQFVEVVQPGGQVIRVDRCPKFTTLLLEVRARFEQRYQLSPSCDLDLLEDPSWESTLRDIQQALPGLSRTDLYSIVPIVARHFLQQGNSTRGRRFVLRRNIIESTVSIETLLDRERGAGVPSSQQKRDRAQKDRRVAGGRTVTESPFGNQNYHVAADTGAAEAGSTLSRSDRIGDKSRFDQEENTAPMGTRVSSQEALSSTDGEASDTQNLPLTETSTSLTLGSSALHGSSRQEEDAHVQAASGEEQSAKQKDWQALGEELARIFDDQKSLNFYVGVHRVAQDPLLVRAIFIKTLYQEQHGGFKQTIGAYFNYMWEKVWGPFRTYDAACAKWNKWENKRDPKGIPPNIQKLVMLYEHDSYMQIAISMGHQMPQAEQETWRPAASSNGGRAQPMTQGQAEELVEAVICYASWYLRDPQIYQEQALGPDAYVMEAAWLEGQPTVFASYDEWLEVHEQMLTLPEEINAWFEAERADQLQRGGSCEDGMSARDRATCVHAALALYAYYGWNATSLSWEELMVLGRPLLGTPDVFIQEESTHEEPEDLIAEGEQLYVRLDDGDLVSFDDYQRTYALLESEQRQEEEERTYEGVLAALQYELLLGVRLGIMRTFGLAVYRQLAACGRGQTEDGIALVTAPEEGQVARACKGLGLGEAWLCLQRLRRTLEPSFYQVKWRPVGLGSCIIAVESQLSGQIYLYDRADQVEQALAELSAWAGEEAQES